MLHSFTTIDAGGQFVIYNFTTVRAGSRHDSKYFMTSARSALSLQFILCFCCLSHTQVDLLTQYCMMIGSQRDMTRTFPDTLSCDLCQSCIRNTRCSKNSLTLSGCPSRCPVPPKSPDLTLCDFIVGVH